MKCTCAKLSLNDALNTSDTGSYNWNRDCEEHGLGSVWYNDVGRPKFEKQNRRLVLLQGLARQRKRGEITLEQAKEMMKSFDEDNI